MQVSSRQAAARLIRASRFVSRAAFISCQGPQLEETGSSPAAAFAAGNWEAVSSLRMDGAVDDSCWFAGDGWWLSTRPT